MGLILLIVVLALFGGINAHAEEQLQDHKQHKEWFLIVPIYHCDSCVSREERLIMPSIEACREIRDLNSGTRCMTEDDEPSRR